MSEQAKSHEPSELVSLGDEEATGRLLSQAVLACGRSSTT